MKPICMALAATHGRHARIGFENNMLMADASFASSISKRSKKNT
jgi:uncharacterized protein (DUF849 family)